MLLVFLFSFLDFYLLSIMSEVPFLTDVGTCVCSFLVHINFYTILIFGVFFSDAVKHF